MNFIMSEVNALIINWLESNNYKIDDLYKELWSSPSPKSKRKYRSLIKKLKRAFPQLKYTYERHFKLMFPIEAYIGKIPPQLPRLKTFQASKNHRPECGISWHGKSTINARDCKYCCATNISTILKEKSRPFCILRDFGFDVLSDLARNTSSSTYYCAHCIQTHLLDTIDKIDTFLELYDDAVTKSVVSLPLKNLMSLSLRPSNKCHFHTKGVYNNGICLCTPMKNWRECHECRAKRAHPYAGIARCRYDGSYTRATCTHAECKFIKK